jgi:hypothetical protein
MKTSGVKEAMNSNEGVAASAVTAGGITYALGMLLPSVTIISVKKRLAELSEMEVERQSLYLVNDAREDIDDMELKNADTVEQIHAYACPASANVTVSELRFVVVVVAAAAAPIKDNALDLISGLPPSPTPIATLGDGTAGSGEGQLNKPCGVAFVPGYPHLVVVSSSESNQVRVYTIHRTRTLSYTVLIHYHTPYSYTTGARVRLAAQPTLVLAREGGRHCGQGGGRV